MEFLEIEKWSFCGPATGQPPYDRTWFRFTTWNIVGPPSFSSPIPHFVLLPFSFWLRANRPLLDVSDNWCLHARAVMAMVMGGCRPARRYWPQPTLIIHSSCNRSMSSSSFAINSLV